MHADGESIGINHRLFHWFIMCISLQTLSDMHLDIFFFWRILIAKFMYSHHQIFVKLVNLFYSYYVKETCWYTCFRVSFPCPAPTPSLVALPDTDRPSTHPGNPPLERPSHSQAELTATHPHTTTATPTLTRQTPLHSVTSPKKRLNERVVSFANSKSLAMQLVPRNA